MLKFLHDLLIEFIKENPKTTTCLLCLCIIVPIMFGIINITVKGIKDTQKNIESTIKSFDFIK